MSDEMNTDETLRKVASVLGWCLVFTIGVMSLWLVFLVCATDLIYGIHSYFFDITKNQMAVTHYAAMAFFKLLTTALFLFPYVGLKIVLRKRPSA